MKKIIAEFRINSHVLFYKHKEEIANYLINDFPDWITDSITFQLINKKSKRFVVLQHNRIAIVSEDAQNEHNFFELVLKVLTAYNEKLEIKEIERAGIRFQTAEKMSLKFSELVKLFQEKFYPNTKEINEIFVKDFSDVAFAGVFIKEGCKFQFQLGPTHRNETLPRMDLKLITNIEEVISDTMLYIDIDGFKEKINYQELLATIPFLRNENHDISEKIMKMFKS